MRIITGSEVIWAASAFFVMPLVTSARPVQTARPSSLCRRARACPPCRAEQDGDDDRENVHRPRCAEDNQGDGHDDGEQDGEDCAGEGEGTEDLRVAGLAGTQPLHHPFVATGRGHRQHGVELHEHQGEDQEVLQGHGCGVRGAGVVGRPGDEEHHQAEAEREDRGVDEQGAVAGELERLGAGEGRRPGGDAGC